MGQGPANPPTAGDTNRHTACGIAMQRAQRRERYTGGTQTVATTHTGTGAQASQAPRIARGWGASACLPPLPEVPCRQILGVRQKPLRGMLLMHQRLRPGRLRDRHCPLCLCALLCSGTPCMQQGVVRPKAKKSSFHSCARRGSSMSRKPSATCSKVSTMSSKHTPGKTPSHHQPAVM